MPVNYNLSPYHENLLKMPEKSRLKAWMNVKDDFRRMRIKEYATFTLKHLKKLSKTFVPYGEWY